MTFKAFKYEILKREVSNTKTIFFSGLFLIVLGMVFFYVYNEIFNFNSGSNLIGLIMLLGLLTVLFSYVYQFFDFEKIKAEKRGFLELGRDELIINYNERIKYEELTNFDLSIEAYFDERINLGYMGYRNPTEKRSLGISNSIKFTHNSETRYFHFKLESKSHQKVLERNIYEIVINEKLNNIEGKKSIKLIPKQYKGFDEYKEYIGKQLRQNKVSCTEGLLLMGYKNYAEAQELKKKYCI